MASCKDCIHEKLCVIKAFPDAFENTQWGKKPCDHFKPKTEWISVVEDPPDEEAWVMGYEGPGNYEIIKIEKGIDEETRDKMRAGDINDPETQGWTAADGLFVIKRSKVFKAADVFGNNKVPYCWKTKSGHTIFGQNITWWRPLPEPPEESKR